MTKDQPEFIVAKDLSFIGILTDIKKSSTALQPIFEAFTNSLEAIKLKTKQDETFNKGEIKIRINVNELIDNNFEFNSCEIFDNGVGFDQTEFTRFNIFKDNTKGFKNLGSGRIQYAHFFEKTVIKSNFIKNNEFFEREFVISKSRPFLDKNAIVKQRYIKSSNVKQTFSNLTFSNLLENSYVYHTLNDTILKRDLLKRYLHYFCFNSTKIPKIIIDFYVNNILKSSSSITKKDIPQFDKKQKVQIPYLKPTKSATSYESTNKKEEFEVATFKVTKDLLDSNDVKLISKGEVVEATKINLTGISKNDNINGNKYLVLVSSNYIDEKDTNNRGELEIPSRNSSKILNVFNSEVIFLEDIEEGVNIELAKLYPEIEEIKEKHKNELQELKEMFFIGDEDDVDINLNDDDKRILEKYYEAQAKKEAKIDAIIKQTIDRLENLDTTSKDYEVELEKEITALVKIIPEQNKRTLSHYIARRKLVIELFSKILAKKLKTQNIKSRDKDEALIHNLLFHQKSTNTYDSDLWLINEEFIYFKGNSEFKLKDLELDGKKVFRTKFEEEEERHLKSLGESRIDRRPDVLLFPEEGKCIIIEFKTPKTNVSDHLTQINQYASLIRNYTTEDFEIKTFYGYLLGEGIEPRDVQGAVTTFEYSHNFDYLYSPAQKVIHFEGKENGSIYTEVLKYTSLLKRAELRNKKFIEKLGLK